MFILQQHCNKVDIETGWKIGVEIDWWDKDGCGCDGIVRGYVLCLCS